MQIEVPGEVQAPPPGGHLFVFKETERPGGGPGRTIGFTNVEVRPRGFDELAAAKPHHPVTIRLEMFNGTIVDTDVAEVDGSKYVNMTATLESPFTSRAIGLVRGGWLPSTLAATRDNAVVMLDRNLVPELLGRFEGGKKRGRSPDFLDLFQDSPIRINPLLYAMEGNGRAIPDPASAKAQLAEVVDKLQKALPAAKLMIGPESMDGLLGLIEGTRSGMMRKKDFLLRVAPGLASPVARRNIDDKWKEILEAADACRVPRFSLVVLAALSAVVVPNGAGPGKRLLKPKRAYGEADAYNALCDLRSLDILLYALACFPEENTQLCTADRNLALFWCGLQATDVQRSGLSISFSLAPHEALLGAQYCRRWATDVAPQ
jgi:hypothetical protein